jgi:hypothetical protein
VILDGGAKVFEGTPAQLTSDEQWISRRRQKLRAAIAAAVA